MPQTEVKIDKDFLQIRIPFDKKGRLSGSNKTLVVASTNGNVATGVKIPGTEHEIILGLNAYYRNPDYKKGQKKAADETDDE